MYYLRWKIEGEYYIIDCYSTDSCSHVTSIYISFHESSVELLALFFILDDLQITLQRRFSKNLYADLIN